MSKDGKGESFQHGAVTEAVASLVFDRNARATLTDIEPPDGDYELLSEEDIEELLNKNSEEDT